MGSDGDGHMSEHGTDLDALLAGLETTDWVDTAPADAGTDRDAIFVFCSMTRAGHDPALWPANDAGAASTLRTVGNQVWEAADDGRAVVADVAHLVRQGPVEFVGVVGHTGCTVVADAYNRYVTADQSATERVAPRLDPLVDLVADAARAGVVDATTDPRTARYRLVEFSVVRQVEFLVRELPAPITVVGYVHDEDGAYSSFPRNHYLVTVDGDTDPETLRSRLPDGAPGRVASVLG
jgi:carbonic anhydrase